MHLLLFVARISQGLQGVYGPNALRSLENAILPESARRVLAWRLTSGL